MSEDSSRLSEEEPGSGLPPLESRVVPIMLLLCLAIAVAHLLVSAEDPAPMNSATAADYNLIEELDNQIVTEPVDTGNISGAESLGNLTE